MPNRKMLRLFVSMLYISAFTFGGGFVIITLMKRKFVDELKWIEEQEMLDLTALAQSAPGAVAVNAAILLGWRSAGLAGTIAAVIGTVLPPLVILSMISFFYAAFAANPYIALLLRGMQAGIVAVIMDLVCDLIRSILREKSIISSLLLIVSFAAAFFYKADPVYIILVAIIYGILNELIGKLQ